VLGSAKADSKRETERLLMEEEPGRTRDPDRERALTATENEASES